MKKFSLLMAVFSLLALFSACSSDDKREEPTPSVDYAGFYKGDIVVSLEGNDLAPIPGKIELIKKNESLAKLELRNFKFGMMSLGDIIVDDVVVTTKDNTVYLNGEEKLTLSLEGVPATCNVKVEATVVNKKMIATIDVNVENPDGGDPLLVKVLFNGDFMTNNESSEAKITAFGLKDIKADVVIEENTIKVTVDHTFAEAIKNVLSVITISEKATIAPALDVVQDFSKAVKYVVTAEDGKTTSTYTVNTIITPAPLSKEANMLSFAITGLNVPVKIDGTNVTFTVEAADKGNLVNALPIITISDKATISPALNIAQDFTKPVVYTVTAEDGITAVSYTVTARIEEEKGTVIPFDFSNAIFDTFKHKKSKNQSALPLTIDPYKWSSSDGGVVALFGAFVNRGEKFGVTYTQNDADFGGPVFNIESLDTKGKDSLFGFPAVPKITSGSLFLGDFNLDTSAPLKSTKFGITIDKKPLSISGKISYKSGSDYFYCPNPTPTESNKVEAVPGKKDEGLIAAVVYEVSNANETLTGLDIYTSDKIIGMAKATYQDGFKGDFKLNIEYSKNFDPSKTYKLALIFSSSKDGDKFSGAGGSVLKLAKLDMSFE